MVGASSKSASFSGARSCDLRDVQFVAMGDMENDPHVAVGNRVTYVIRSKFCAQRRLSRSDGGYSWLVT